jgi:hypothetical protein
MHRKREAIRIYILGREVFSVIFLHILFVNLLLNMWKNSRAYGLKNSIHGGFTHFFMQILTQDG